MSVNRYRPHVLVLPEDDANRQLANGFLLHPDLPPRAIQVLEEVGGWKEVLLRFRTDHIAGMERYADRFIILLIDFDAQEGRLQYAKAGVPEQFSERVFFLGAWTEPEALKKALSRTYEEIGQDLARDCRDGNDNTWRHELLRHNAAELDRLRTSVRPILFPEI
jgi:hypothetical protein